MGCTYTRLVGLTAFEVEDNSVRRMTGNVGQGCMSRRVVVEHCSHKRRAAQETSVPKGVR